MKQIYKVLLVLGIFLIGLRTVGQVRITNEEELELLRATPLETIYLHSNATLFFPGEYLYYSLYTINTQTYRLSDISKVAYVQLIGERGKVVFTQKVSLDGGKGQGDYFFPTDLPSGNYKLVGFTHWMKNAGISQFFMSDLTFLNPYRSDQNVFLSDGTRADSCPPGSAEDTEDEEGSSNSELGLVLEITSFAPGEAARIRLRNYKGALGHGTYSLSIRKVDEFPAAGHIPATKFSSRYPDLQQTIPQRVNDILAIPEQRGELISGRVFEKDTKTPLRGRMLALSLPGANFQIKKALTDLEGKFYTYVTRPFQEQSGIVEQLPPGRAPGTFEWNSPDRWEGNIHCFYHFELKEDMKEAIRKRSIHNQIENSYFEVKPDTLQAPEASGPFEGEKPIIYQLEDYTRFPTLRETIIEILENVWIKREDAKTDNIMVYLPGETAAGQFGSTRAMVVADGILVPDHGAFLEYDARKISTVKVIRQKYLLGGTEYNGVLVVETLDRQYEADWESEYGARFPYLPPVPLKSYFRQGKPDAHIPDFRYQLLWEPNMQLDGPGETVSFYTSQVPGRYEIVLEGFTTYGKPISLKAYIEVKEE
ncbi:MAG: hypothetical protein P8Z38_03790 [Robiginitalea sp.]